MQRWTRTLRQTPLPGLAMLVIRQFLTGNGILAFFDIPWAPIYLAVLFFLHPVLGYAALVFAAIQGALAWFGHRHTVAPSEAASRAVAESGAYLQSKLRNAEVLESMGMVHNLRPHWKARHDKGLDRSMEIAGVHLVEKHGGRSGSFVMPAEA